MRAGPASVMTGAFCSSAQCSSLCTFARVRRLLSPRVLSLGVFLATAPVAARAQGIALLLGDSARVAAAPGATLAVPLRVELPAAGATLNLASLTGTLGWSSARLTLDSIRANPTTGFTVQVNTQQAATGTAPLTAYSATRLAASSTMVTAYFTVGGAAGGTRVLFAPSAAGNEAGQSVLAALFVRPLEVCVSQGGRWGDVNDDGVVSVLDAQQVGRSTIRLTVANPAMMAGRGDVTADGIVNVLDAQQILRHTVGLSAAARVNTLLPAPTGAAAMVVTPPAPSVYVGDQLSLIADVRDAAGIPLAGCVPVTWSSSAPSFATVSPEGVVRGVSVGTATITATSQGKSAVARVTVRCRPGTVCTQ
jgi:hypothetical protein